MSVAEHSARSARAVRVLRRVSAFKSGARIAVFLSFDAEPDTAALLSAARQRGIRLYVPAITDRRHHRMRFYPLAVRKTRGAFGLFIPRVLEASVDARWFKLIVVPLVGVDAEGRRLGFGGGFYDRVLAFRRTRRHWRGPLLVGLAFDCQRVPNVCADPWDIRLDALATESGLAIFAKDLQ